LLLVSAEALNVGEGKIRLEMGEPPQSPPDFPEPPHVPKRSTFVNQTKPTQERIRLGGDSPSSIDMVLAWVYSSGQNMDTVSVSMACKGEK